jgi:DNA-binding MarR family transcriptional regulator
MDNGITISFMTSKERAPLGNSVDESASEVWRRIRTISHNPAAMAACHQVTKETGLSLAPQRALLVFPLERTISMRELATRLGCDNSYVTSLVDALEERNLAFRQPHPHDRRIKVIALTSHGQSVAKRLQLADITPPMSFVKLSKREMTQLRNLLRKVDTD